jgi:DNA-binding transcriptional LysR family regulator
MLNLQELTVFVAAAEGRSFSEGARRLHLSQPSVSQTIKNLERQLGVKLFVRVGHHAQLSDFGEILLPMARQLLANAQQIEEEVAALSGSVVGRFDIGCSTTSGKYLLPRLIARFRDQFPQVRINVLISSRETVLKRLLEGQTAFGVSSKCIDHQNLDYQSFFCDEVILIAPADHPWSKDRHIELRNLLDVPILLRESGSGTFELVMQALGAHHISPDMLDVAMVLGNTEAIAMSVEEGLGVAFVSRLAAVRQLEMGHVVEIGVENLDLRRNLYLARNRAFPFTRAQSTFWDFVRASAPLVLGEARGLRRLRQAGRDEPCREQTVSASLEQTRG